MGVLFLSQSTTYGGNSGCTCLRSILSLAERHTRPSTANASMATSALAALALRRESCVAADTREVVHQKGDGDRSQDMTLVPVPDFGPRLPRTESW